MKKTMFVAIAILAIVLGIVAYASAFTTDTQSVAVNASVNSKLTIGVSSNSLTFAVIDPETVSPAQVVNVTVKSNKLYNLTKVISGQNAEMGLATSLASHAPKDLPVGTGTTVYPDSYTVNFPYSTDPAAAYIANVQYTATQ